MSETTESSETPEKSEAPERQSARKNGPQFHGHHYYTELNRVVSTLFVGVLALMTFLLTVGVQRPHAMFSWALYSAIIILSLNLIAYMAGHLFEGSRLKVVRLIQQILFVLAVASVAWFAISAAQFFFAIPASPAGAPPQ